MLLFNFDFGKSSRILMVLLLASSYLHAEGDSPEQVLEQHFWGNIYADGGQTFYCKKDFAKKSPLIAESYVYSTSWIKDHLKCGTNRQCKRESKEYCEILSDLHNIVPADAYFDFKRKTAFFGTVDESVEANDCGIRKSFQIIEPDDSIKGDIARILAYMHTSYDLPLEQSVNELNQWNELDPPSPEEIERNERIMSLQGKSNPFVEDPSLMQQLRQ